MADLDRWVADNVLSRFSPLFREARYLLAEEPDIRDNAVYHSVLSAVAEGNGTRGGTAGYLERKATDISHHLSVLGDAGLLAREVDVFRPGRSVYRISEPLIAFYHAIMRPEGSRLERRGQAAQVWRDSAHRFATSVVGPRFEQICRDWMQAYASPEINGIPVSQAGSGLVNDPQQKKSHQVDVAAFGNDADGRRVLLAIGEAKWAETSAWGTSPACAASGTSWSAPGSLARTLPACSSSAAPSRPRNSAPRPRTATSSSSASMTSTHGPCPDLTARSKALFLGGPQAQHPADLTESRMPP